MEQYSHIIVGLGMFLSGYLAGRSHANFRVAAGKLP